MNSKAVRTTGHVIFAVFMICLSVLFLYPLLYTLLASLKNNNEIYANPFGMPQHWEIANYAKAWVQAKLGVNFGNSVFLTSITMVCHLLFGSMAAFVITRFHLRIGKIMAAFFSVGMMIPIQAILIPITKMSVEWNMSDNYLFLLGVYVAGGLPSTIFIISGYLSSFPSEIEEAATIDGCSIYKFYWKMLLPISKPIFVTMGIMSFVSTWNELMVAMVLIKDNMRKTLPLGLLNFTGAFSTDNAGLCAAIIITIIPTVIVYLLLQENVEKGLAEGAVKG